MKKIQLLLISALTLCFSKEIIAQPTLTAANTNPTLTDTFTVAGCNAAGVTEGAAGGNVTWDFTTLTKVGTSTSNYKGCNASPGCSMYPTSNIVDETKFLMSHFNPRQYLHFKTTSDKLSFLGSYTSNFSNLVCTDELDLLRFPMTINNNYKDSFSQTDGDYDFFGQVTVTADAYGTLKLPYGTFQNVLRIHRAYSTYDNSPLPTARTSHDYVWYLPGTRHPLLVIYKTKANNAPTFNVTVGYLDSIPNSIKEINSNKASIQISPNPSQGSFSVSISTEKSEAIDVVITDVTGRVVFQEKMFSNKPAAIKLDEPKGIYLLNVISQDNSRTVEKLVIQ